MSITGIEKLEFGVDDLNHSAKFMRDFGLTGDASGRAFTTLSGARVERRWMRCARSWNASPLSVKSTARWSAAIPTV